MTVGIGPIRRSSLLNFGEDMTRTKTFTFALRRVVGVVIISASVLGLTHSAEAADRYVRQGAVGNGSGSDWSNACPGFTGACAVSNLKRGDTYYVADGDYGTVTLNTPVSGTAPITIRKASVGNHGTNTGWSNAFGDGQAVFGSFIMVSDYWIIDGVYRNESVWNAVGSYGFRATSVYSNTLNYGHCSDNVTIRYVEIGGPYSETFNNLNRSFYLGGFTETCDNWTISRNFIHNTGEANLIGAHNTVFEYNWFGPTWGKEIIRGQSQATNLVIRYNIFRNGCRDEQEPGSGCTAEVGVFANQGSTPNFNGFRAYGNVTWKTIRMHKTDASYLVQASDCLIYNNTIYDDSPSGTSSVRCTGGGSSAVRNNISYLPNGMSGGCQATTCDNNSIYTSSSPFVDAAAGNFHLRSALVGIGLPSPYDFDLSGVKRGSDGLWDRGAFELVGGGTPTAPTNLQIVR